MAGGGSRLHVARARSRAGRHRYGYAHDPAGRYTRGHLFLGHRPLRGEQAHAGLNEGQTHIERGQWENALEALERGLAAAREIPFHAGLREALDRHLGLAERTRSEARRATLAGDLHRSAERVRFLDGAGRLPPGQVEDRGLMASGPSPSQQVARREQAVLLADALGELPADYREVIVLRHLEALTFPQVAQRMGRTLDSVEKLWMRALVCLRGLLESLA